MSSSAVTSLKSLTICTSFLSCAGIIEHNPDNYSTKRAFGMYLSSKILQKCSESLTTVRICVDELFYYHVSREELKEFQQRSISYFIWSFPTLLAILSNNLPNLTKVDVQYEYEKMKFTRFCLVRQELELLMCRAWRSLHVFRHRKPQIDSSPLSTLLFKLDELREDNVETESD